MVGGTRDRVGVFGKGRRGGDRYGGFRDRYGKGRVTWVPCRDRWVGDEMVGDLDLDGSGGTELG